MNFPDADRKVGKMFVFDDSVVHIAQIWVLSHLNGNEVKNAHFEIHS